MPSRLRAFLRFRVPRLFGLFAFQANNTTRTFEYPWAWHVAPPLVDRQRVVEVGGSLEGFQFVLSRHGAEVMNVDPGESASGIGWQVRHDQLQRLNHAFGTDVKLLPCTLQQCRFEESSVDRLYSISTIEHILDEAELDELAVEIGRVLKPGALAILTVDLFLDVEPFSRTAQNRFGINVDLWRFIGRTGLQLETGVPDYICGGPGFDPAAVLGRLADLFVGESYPTLIQTIVLRKPSLVS